jgi:hypothetical protein
MEIQEAIKVIRALADGVNRERRLITRWRLATRHRGHR